MSFFTKAIGNTGRFFTKGVKPLTANFFRKGGGLDGLSRGLRQSSNVIRGIGGGIKSVSQSPLVLAGGTMLGTYMGNPLLGTQIASGGSAIGSGLEGGATLLGAGREITNRNKYLTKEHRQNEEDAMMRQIARRERNELEKQLPSVPTTPPVMRIEPQAPIYSVPAVDYQSPPVMFSFN